MRLAPQALELGIVEHSFTPGAKVTYLNYAGGVFAQAWAVNGWQTQGAVNSDGDPQPEIIMFNGADGHYGLFDGITGGSSRRPSDEITGPSR